MKTNERLGMLRLSVYADKHHQSFAPKNIIHHVEMRYKQYSVESAECSSSGTEGSESEGEDELKQILSQLMDDNKQLSQQAAELSQKILKEREACVDIKVKMRLLQNEAKMLKI
ncbi:ralA-binding protein 1 isoform X2 [Ixodes scapularis]